MVVDYYAVVCSTKKCLLCFLGAETFLWCEMNSQVMTTAQADLVMNFVYEAIRLGSDITGNRNLNAAARIFRDENTALPPTQKATFWKVEAQLVVENVTLKRILHFVLAMLEKCFSQGL